MSINGKTIIFILAGGIFAYGGITGKSTTKLVQSFIVGGGPQTVGQDPTLAIVDPVDPGTVTTNPLTGSTAIAPSATYGGQYSALQEAGGSVAVNQATARLLAAPYGWSVGAEWDALVNLWNQESTWSNTAWNNPPNGAYGIPQALPYTKMPKAAWPPSAGGSASATSQINWGLNYIRSVYGTPSAAWAHEQSVSWY